MAHRGVAPVDQAPERHGGSSTSRHRLRRHVGRLPKVPRRGQRRRSPTSPASCTRPSPTRCEGGARNPADAVSPPTATKAQTEWWSVDELRRFLVHAADDELYAAWLLFATTGARTGEVVGLTWTDLDLDHGWMRVDWTLGHVGHRLTWKARPPSRAGERTMALDPATVAALREHRRRQLEERILAGPAWNETFTDWQGLARTDRSGPTARGHRSTRRPSTSGGSDTRAWRSRSIPTATCSRPRTRPSRTRSRTSSSALSDRARCQTVVTAPVLERVSAGQVGFVESST